MAVPPEGLSPSTPGDSGPAVVAFGGGTGMSLLLRGLKPYTSNVTAVVTVTDNGGSSGRLRQDYDMVPPGDIRNCIAALSDAEPVLQELVQYRFEESELEGHSFGNLLIMALTRVTGSFDDAVRELNRILRVRGQVLPITGRKISLIARHPDGSKSTGEVAISSSGKPISRMEVRPRVTSVQPDLKEAIEGADLMIFGPGSLFTSIIPNLLVKPILSAIQANPCKKIYVANVMTQPGETTGLDLAGHLRAIEDHGGGGIISGIVLHDGEIAGEILEAYEKSDAHRVDGVDSLDPALEVCRGDIVEEQSRTIRHHPGRLGELIFESYLSGVAGGSS